MCENWRNVFVTVGTTRFDSLIDSILSDCVLSILSSKGCVNLTIQIGSSELKHINCDNKFNININVYNYKNSILDDIEWSDVVIGHAGAGTVLEVLRCDKPLLIVVNEDLMNNHQTELANRLQNENYLFYCTVGTISSKLNAMNLSQLKRFPKPNPKLFANFLNNMFANSNKSHID